MGPGPCPTLSTAPYAARTSKKPSSQHAVHTDRGGVTQSSPQGNARKNRRRRCELYQRTALITSNVPRASLRTLRKSSSAQQVTQNLQNRNTSPYAVKTSEKPSPLKRQRGNSSLSRPHDVHARTNAPCVNCNMRTTRKPENNGCCSQGSPSRLKKK